MSKIILATTSPYRKEAFGFLGINFTTEASNVAEQFEGRPENPEELVKHLAKLKAESVAKNHKEGIVIGFDSVGLFNGRILEKPKNKDEAFQRLKSMSGKIHEFFTGIHMINISTKQEISKVVKTTAKMRNYSELEIEKHLNQDKEFNKKALAYDPWGHYSTSFVKTIEGSYNNLLRGIPLEVIMETLFELGYRV